MWRIGLAASSMILTACDSSPRLKYAQPGAKLKITSSETLSIEDTGVSVTGHRGVWQAGVDVWRPVVLFDVENQSDERWCLAAYFQVDGYTQGEWGNGAPIIVAPRSTVTQIAGFLGSNALVEELPYEQKFEARRPIDGACVDFRPVDEVFPTGE